MCSGVPPQDTPSLAQRCGEKRRSQSCSIHHMTTSLHTHKHTQAHAHAHAHTNTPARSWTNKLTNKQKGLANTQIWKQPGNHTCKHACIFTPESPFSSYIVVCCFNCQSPNYPKKKCFSHCKRKSLKICTKQGVREPSVFIYCFAWDCGPWDKSWLNPVLSDVWHRVSLVFRIRAERRPCCNNCGRKTSWFSDSRVNW